MGGGGFTMEPDNAALDRYALSLTGRRRPRVCLLPTASGDDEELIERFRRRFQELDCEPSHVALFRLGKRPVALDEHLLAQDLIYVSGGSMRNLLAVWREHGVDTLLRTAWKQGTVLCGLSAGSLCWFELGVTSSGGAPQLAPGLGLLPGSNCVHYDGEPERRPVYRRAIREGAPDGFAADDGVGLLFHGRRLERAVASRPYARAFEVRRVRGDVIEVPIAVERLPEALRPTPAVPADIEEFRAVARLRGQG